MFVPGGYVIDEQVNLIGMICISYLHITGDEPVQKRALHCKDRPCTLRKVISKMTGLDTFIQCM